MRENMVELLTRSEDIIVKKIINAIKLSRFSEFNNLSYGDWQFIVKKIIQVLAIYIRCVDEDFIPLEKHKERDVVRQFATEYARIKLNSGFTPKMLISLIKHYRRSCIDIILESNIVGAEKMKSLRLLNNYFDDLEICLYKEWDDEASRQKATRLVTKDKGKILLVEDNPINQRLVIMLLSEKYFVTVVENGLEALEILKDNCFNLILMDMQMPVMDGYEATRRIRASSQFNKLPIVALTANAMKGDKEKCLMAGCNSYVAKPINTDTLLKTISQYFSDTLNKKQRTRDKGVETLVPWYLQDMEEELEKLKHAAKIKDYTTVRYIGHGLKGTGGAYGFPEFSLKGAEIEGAAIKEDNEIIEKLVREMCQLYTDILEEEF